MRLLLDCAVSRQPQPSLTAFVNTVYNPSLLFRKTALRCGSMTHRAIRGANFWCRNYKLHVNALYTTKHKTKNDSKQSLSTFSVMGEPCISNLAHSLIVTNTSELITNTLHGHVASRSPSVMAECHIDVENILHACCIIQNNFKGINFGKFYLKISFVL